MRLFTTPVALLTGLWLTATTVTAQTHGSRPAGALAAGMMQLRALPTNPAGQPASETNAVPVLRQALAFRPDDELRLLRTETDELGGHHLRYQQYYRGVKVEHGVVTAHASGGALKTVSGAWTLPSAAFDVHPALPEALALKRALASVGARKYMWEDPAEEANLRQQTNSLTATYRPTGELVVVEDFRQPAQGAAARPMVLAWKFNVYAQQPMSRALIYVDAHTGDVVLRDNIIKHLNAPGTFATRYSGVKTSTTDQIGGGFRLRETTRGKGVTTLNCRRGTSLAAAVDFVDNDNNWTAAEYNNANFDNAALDAHLGAQATHDYWMSQHGRDSYDNHGAVLLSYVHFDQGYEGAFWNGTAMVYGDGSGAFKPLTSVDVCAHEIGHAICDATASLVYGDESGALNEGFSDIWGACVEHHFDPTKQTWLLGEEIMLSGVAMRSMRDPNTQGQPDTYFGDFWDALDVHTNSGVLNFWFYLLSEGGAGTNDNGTSYNVTGIAIRKAAQIAYRAEQIYLTPNSMFVDARQATLQSAIDLFGLGSAEVMAAAHAWRAVGLDEMAPSLTAMTPTSGPIGTVVNLTGTHFGTAFKVTFNGIPATIATLEWANQLTVVVPPGATTGPVVVTTTSGTATSAGVFTMTGNPTAAPTILSITPVGGAPQGATVTLTGTNFTGTTAVLFDGVSAAFTVVSATQITATVPATAASGPLSVRNANGTVTAPTPFLVLPSITNLTPATGVVGAPFAITGTSLNDAFDVKFNNLYAAFTMTSANRLSVIVPVGATTGVVTVRTPSGIATSPLPFVVTPSPGLVSFEPTQGNPLTTIVTIRGMGFTGATAVRFNTTPATTFTVASDTELWATIPAGATTGRITVVAPLGTVMSTSIFTVIIPGAPLITSFTPMLGAVGTPVTISGTNFMNATSVKFNGTPAMVTRNTSTEIYTTVPVGATTGQITVTTALGTAASATSFRVTDPPANDLCSAANLPVLVCGAPALLGTTLYATKTGDPWIYACGPSSFDSGAGVLYRLVGTGGAVTVKTCGSITNYDTRLYVFSGTCAAPVCVGGNDDACSSTSSAFTFVSMAGTSYFVLVTGWNNDVGDFSLEAICSPLPAAPTMTSFSPTSGPVATRVTIVGTNLTNTSSVRFNGTTATIVANTPNRLIVSVSVGAATGPITVVTPSDTLTSVTPFTVVLPPPISSTMTPLSGPVGTTVTLNGTNFTGATLVQFGGVTASGFIVNSAGTRLTVPVPTGAGYAPLRVTTPAGITQSASSFCTQYTAVGTGASRCGTGTVTLLASGAPAAAARYVWYTTATGGTAIAGATAATFTTPNLSATTTYYVAVSPAAACAGPRVPVVAIVRNLPTATITATGPTTICSGDSVMLTATGGTTYRWSNGATTATILVSGGQYTVVATNAGGCTATSAPVIVVERPRTTPIVTAAPQASGIVILTSSAATGNQWYFGGIPIVGATGPTYTVSTSTQSGLYSVMSTDPSTGCQSLMSLMVQVTVTGTAAELTAAAWALWPNPAGQEVRSTGLAPGTALSLFDATGRLVRTTHADAAGAAMLDVAALPRGVYAVRLTGGATKRLVLE